MRTARCTTAPRSGHCRSYGQSLTETHRQGYRAGCHSLGGQGLIDAIIAGCDSIEHGYSLTQEHCNMMAEKGLFFDPTLVRYTEPYMDDNDDKNTGSKFRDPPHHRRERPDVYRHQRGQDCRWHRSRRLDLRAWNTGPRVHRTGQAGWHDSGAGPCRPGP